MFWVVELGSRTRLGDSLLYVRLGLVLGGGCPVLGLLGSLRKLAELVR